MNTPFTSRMLPVPPEYLKVDPEIAEDSPKYGKREIQEFAATVPLVYEELSRGSTDEQLLAMRSSSDPHEHALGTTYSKMFRSKEPLDAIRATYDNGHLVVDAGNHRVRAARELGLPAVPVLVQARDEALLDGVDRQMSSDRPAERDAHRRLDEYVRSSNRTVTRETGPEFEPPRDWGRPERDR